MKYLIFLIFFNFGLYASSQSQTVAKEANALAKKYQLAHFGVGFYGPKKGYSFSYIIYKKMTIDDARMLIVSFAQDLKRNTNLFDLSSEFEGEEEGKKVLLLSINSLDAKGTHISGSDCIANVMLFFGILTYHIYDGSEFVVIYKENFDEAAQKVSTSILQKDF